MIDNMAKFNKAQATQLHEMISSLLDSKLESILSTNKEMVSKVGSLDQQMSDLELLNLSVKQAVEDVKVIKEELSEMQLEIELHQEGWALLWNTLNRLEDRIRKINLVINIEKNFDSDEVLGYI
ncbi:hypothetical protein CHUAL_009543 [Chamberlinius hualienensis]